MDRELGQVLLRGLKLLPIVCLYIGCASIDATDANLTNSQDGKALVYGRINVVLSERSAQWQPELSEQLTSAKAFWTKIDGRFFVNLFNQSTGERFEPEIYNDGSFYWKLPPGKYIVAGYRWLKNGAFVNTEMRGPIRASLEIHSEISSCYVGSLRIVFKYFNKGPDELTVSNDLQSANKALSQRFPSLKINSEVCLLGMMEVLQ